MTKTEQTKLVQQLNEAHATEVALVRTLGAHIAMTPSGAYRTALEQHRRETRDHAEQTAQRARELNGSASPLEAGAQLVQNTASQVLALSKAPLDMIRRGSAEEKLLKNARDECASEAFEIATYDALEALALAFGDQTTADLAARIRGDEERALTKLRGLIPQLTGNVARKVRGNATYDLSKTGAARDLRHRSDQARETLEEVRDTAVGAVRSTSRQARKVPGVARLEGEIKGALASVEDLPISDYDGRTAEEIVHRLSDISQIDLAKIDAYERKTDNRKTVLDRIASLRGSEPWPGYDELTVEDIRTAIKAVSDQEIDKIREYERRHKNRHGVLEATERVQAQSA